MLFNCLANPFAVCRLLSGDFIAWPIFLVACLAYFTVSFSNDFILSLPYLYTMEKPWFSELV